MILKFQYLISGFTFIASSISVIIATNKPTSYEDQLISEISYIEKLSEEYENNVSDILEAAEKRRNSLAKIVQNLQEKKSDKSIDGTSIWGNSGNSKKSFSTIMNDFGWKVIKDEKTLNRLAQYKKEKQNMLAQCQEWNSKSYNMLFINYLVWCTSKSPFLAQ